MDIGCISCYDGECIENKYILKLINLNFKIVCLKTEIVELKSSLYNTIIGKPSYELIIWDSITINELLLAVHVWRPSRH